MPVLSSAVSRQFTLEQIRNFFRRRLARISPQFTFGRYASVHCILEQFLQTDDPIIAADIICPNLLLRAIAKRGTYESLLACPLVAHPRKSYRKPWGKKKLKLQFMCEELRLEIRTWVSGSASANLLMCWNKLLGGNRDSDSIYIQVVYIHKIKCTRHCSTRILTNIKSFIYCESSPYDCERICSQLPNYIST